MRVKNTSMRVSQIINLIKKDKIKFINAIDNVNNEHVIDDIFLGFKPTLVCTEGRDGTFNVVKNGKIIKTIIKVIDENKINSTMLSFLYDYEVNIIILEPGFTQEQYDNFIIMINRYYV